MSRDGSAGADLKFRGGAEVIDVTVGDDDHLQIGGVDAGRGDAVPDLVAAGGHTAIDEDGAAPDQ